MTINYNLNDRDVAENLWLWRHRQRSELGVSRGRREGAMSQVEAAALLNLSLLQYTNLEHGNQTLLTAADLVRLGNHECWNLDDPSLAELCFLARRRSGMLVKDVAAAVGLSPYTFTKAEEAGEERILRFWTKQGFRFPGRAAAPVKLTRPGVAA